MKRFLSAYLLAIFVVTLLINLLFILIYGRQFLYDAAVICSNNCPRSESGLVAAPFLLINATALVLFILGYYLVRLLIKTTK
jgi:hypothetical protein